MTVASPEDIKAACIDSLVIHVRSLEEFIWGNPQDEHPHDALASDFFADGEWEETRKRIRTLRCERWRSEPAARVAHLSYRRLGMTEEARRWQFDVIVCDTAPAVTIATQSFDDLGEFRRASFEEMLNASLAQMLSAEAPPRAAQSSPKRWPSVPELLGRMQSAVRTVGCRRAAPCI